MEKLTKANKSAAYRWLKIVVQMFGMEKCDLLIFECWIELYKKFNSILRLFFFANLKKHENLSKKQKKPSNQM